MYRNISYLFLILLIQFSSSQLVWAQDYSFHRYFQSTITIDDPFIGDKLILSDIRTESPAVNGGDTWTTNPQLLFGKRITPDLQATIIGSYLHIQNPRQATQNGFDNWVIGLRYNVFQIPQTSTTFSIALNATLGGTGSRIVNATSTTSISPQILLGQGFLALPDCIKYLRPLGLFLEISPNIVTSNMTTNNITIGTAIEYSLPFLQEMIENFHVRLLDHLVPIVEFPFTICTQGSCHGRTTGTINPGLIFFNRCGQVGFEAIIPSNSYTGSKVGGVIQLHLFLDSILI